MLVPYWPVVMLVLRDARMNLFECLVAVCPNDHNTVVKYGTAVVSLRSHQCQARMHRVDPGFEVPVVNVRTASMFDDFRSRRIWKLRLFTKLADIICVTLRCVVRGIHIYSIGLYYGCAEQS